MILATAFTPFGTAATNASEELLCALGEVAGVTRVVLPTEYEGAARQIVHHIRKLHPTAVICFGVAGRSDCVRLERVARNWDEAPAPDNAGDLRSGQVILPGAPEEYRATLSYDLISDALVSGGIPHLFSDDAGGYVCNHTFFSARHEIEKLDREIACGFVHVPEIRAPEEFAVLLEAVKICIGIAARPAVRETANRISATDICSTHATGGRPAKVIS